MLDKRSTLFPSKAHFCFLSHCSISPLYVAAASAAAGLQHSMMEGGITSIGDFVDVLPRFRSGFASFMKTVPDNISFVHSTAEAMCQIANGYPFDSGDQIISYIHEYPSNHYPWAMQRRRGVELLLLPDKPQAPDFSASGQPGGWSMEDLENLCGKKTRVVALSHVQFASGYGADLKELGSFCRERKIDLIIDGAQSLGCLPLYPEEYGISAVAASGWKWLMGPLGAAVLYTNQQLREKLLPTMAGPGMMRQRFDYLDHSWNPVADSSPFEYSSIPWDHAAALMVIAEDIFNRQPIEEIRDEVFRLQDLFLEQLDQRLFKIQRFGEKHRSGICTILPKVNLSQLIQELSKEKIVFTEQAGLMRLAPHFYQEDSQLTNAAAVCNRIASIVLKQK